MDAQLSEMKELKQDYQNFMDDFRAFVDQASQMANRLERNDETHMDGVRMKSYLVNRLTNFLDGHEMWNPQTVSDKLDDIVQEYEDEDEE